MKEISQGFELHTLDPPSELSDLPPFDADKYREELNGTDITEEQATEFLRALDFILRSFVDLGWGVDSVQSIFPEMKEFSALPDSSEIQILNGSRAFNDAARKDEDHE